MRIPELHDWPRDYHSAVAVQEATRARLIERPAPNRIRYIAGADVSYSRGSDDLHAAVVVLQFPSLELVEERAVHRVATFPYIPGLLSFREGPAVIDAFRAVRMIPDIVIFDGHGVAHPRGFGLAAHMGVWLDLPTIGCAKKKLVGDYSEPALARGSRRPLRYNGAIVGKAVRTRDSVKPVFVSCGQYMRLEDAVRIVLASGRGRRLPEPTQRAHLAVNRIRRERES